jgi:mannose-1-phosphate guanylyltransferase
MNADNAVVRLRGGRFGEEVWSADFVGVQVLSEGARSILPPDGCLVGDVYLPALARGAHLIVSPCVSGFVDIGTPQAYHASNMDWLNGRSEGVFCANDAHIGPGVSVVKSVVGAGAVVQGRGAVDRCVIWPGARARAPLTDTIVLSSGKCVTVN